MLMILWVLLWPESALSASSWYLGHLPQMMAVAVVIDLVFWTRVYRRYRKTHPWEKVTLR